MTKIRDTSALIFAMTFPAFMGWIYFIVLPSPEEGPSHSNPLLTWALGLGKTIQFAFPLVFVACFERSRLWPTRPNWDGIYAGLAFGLATALAIIGLYFFVLKESGLFDATGKKAAAWLSQLELNTPERYISLAVFYSLVHSLMEEYYWRWFVYVMLRRRMAWGWAAVISGLAFTAHHVVLLYFYLPGNFWLAAVPFSLGVAIGGAIWAWIYERSGSLYAVWASHCLVDMALLAVGYDLLSKYW